MRCGILGPILRDEFETQLSAARISVLKGAVEAVLKGAVEVGEREGELLSGTSSAEEGGPAARVGLISHIGGHKFAGNVILYIPPGSRTAGGDDNSLAGCGVWYGRVEPKHVEGIIQETILEGKVIEELFRGGIRQGGEILRL